MRSGLPYPSVFVGRASANTSMISLLLSMHFLGIHLIAFCWYFKRREIEDSLGFIELLSSPDLSPSRQSNTTSHASSSRSINQPSSAKTTSQPPKVAKRTPSATSFAPTVTPNPKVIMMDSLRDIQANISQEVEDDSKLSPAQNASKSRTKSMIKLKEKRAGRKVHPYPSGRGREAVEESPTVLKVVLAVIPYTVSYNLEILITWSCINTGCRIMSISIKDLTKSQS